MHAKVRVREREIGRLTDNEEPSDDVRIHQSTRRKPALPSQFRSGRKTAGDGAPSRAVLEGGGVRFCYSWGKVDRRWWGEEEVPGGRIRRMAEFRMEDWEWLLPRNGDGDREGPIELN